MHVRKLVAVGDDSRSTSVGLLLLRVIAGLSLFAKHGLEKLTGYSTMVQHFPDPVHVGAHAGLAFALVADGICSLLMVIGLATRPAAFLSLVNLSVAFFLVHHAAFLNVPHVEVVVLYMAIMLALIFTGPGRFSVDALLAGPGE